jgi:hypothetical protein
MTQPYRSPEVKRFEAQLRQRVAEKLPNMTPTQAQAAQALIEKSVKTYRKKVETLDRNRMPELAQQHRIQREEITLER